MLKPPGEALTKLRHSLRLSDIEIQPTTDLTDYVVYDSDGNAYAREDLPGHSDGDNSDRVEELIETIHTTDGRQQRRALAHLALIVEDTPVHGIDAIPVLTSEVRDADPVFQAESIYIFAEIAEEYSEHVTPVAAEVITLLDSKTDSRVLEDAVDVVAAIADHDPNAVVDGAPKLAALLQDDTSVEATALTALQRIATSRPDAVVPLTRHIVTYLDEGDAVNRVTAIALFGALSKEYPNVAEETFPATIDLIDADHYMVRANAAGLLADLADEYPDQVQPSLVPSSY